MRVVSYTANTRISERKRSTRLASSVRRMRLTLAGTRTPSRANCDHPGSRRAEQKSTEVGRAVAGIPRQQNERIVYLALPEFLVGNNYVGHNWLLFLRVRMELGRDEEQYDCTGNCKDSVEQRHNTSGDTS